MTFRILAARSRLFVICSKIAAACYANETYMQAANTLTYTLPATNVHQNERTI